VTRLNRLTRNPRQQRVGQNTNNRRIEKSLRGFGSVAASGTKTLAPGDQTTLHEMTGTVTVNSGTAGWVFTLFNNSGSNKTLAEGSCTLIKMSTKASGTITVPDKTIVTVTFVTASVAFVTGV